MEEEEEVVDFGDISDLIPHGNKTKSPAPAKKEETKSPSPKK